jgi:DNA polymerase-3 subunit beta
MITIHSSELLRAIRRVAPIVPAKTPVPIMSCIALRASGGTATFAATDSHRSIRTSVPCEGDLAVALPAKTLSSIAASLPAGDVVVELVPGGASIRAGRARFKVPSMPIEDFPPLHATTGDLLASMPAAALGDLLRSVQHATSDDISRPHLAGIQLELGDGTATAIATDGHRLSMASIPCEAVGVPTLLPSAVASSVIGLCLEREEAEGVVLLREGRHLVVERGDTSLRCVLGEDAFPPWRKIMPSTNRKGGRASVLRADLMAALHRVSLVSDRESSVLISIADDALKLSAQSPDSGESSEDVPAMHAKDGESRINATYLSDLLRACSGERIEIALGQPLEPVAVYDFEETRQAVGVIMPMRA